MTAMTTSLRSTAARSSPAAAAIGGGLSLGFRVPFEPAAAAETAPAEVRPRSTPGS